MNRGSDVNQRVVPRPGDCFNEAPIHESGKSGAADKQPDPDLQLQ